MLSQSLLMGCQISLQIPIVQAIASRTNQTSLRQLLQANPSSPAMLTTIAQEALVLSFQLLDAALAPERYDRLDAQVLSAISAQFRDDCLGSFLSAHQPDASAEDVASKAEAFATQVMQLLEAFSSTLGQHEHTLSWEQILLQPPILAPGDVQSHLADWIQEVLPESLTLVAFLGHQLLLENIFLYFFRQRLHQQDGIPWLLRQLREEGYLLSLQAANASPEQLVQSFERRLTILQQEELQARQQAMDALNTNDYFEAQNLLESLLKYNTQQNTYRTLATMTPESLQDAQDAWRQLTASFHLFADEMGHLCDQFLVALPVSMRHIPPPTQVQIEPLVEDPTEDFDEDLTEDFPTIANEPGLPDPEQSAGPAQGAVSVDSTDAASTMPASGVSDLGGSLEARLGQHALLDPAVSASMPPIDPGGLLKTLAWMCQQAAWQEPLRAALSLLWPPASRGIMSSGNEGTSGISPSGSDEAGVTAAGVADTNPPDHGAALVSLPGQPDAEVGEGADAALGEPSPEQDGVEESDIDAPPPLTAGRLRRMIAYYHQICVQLFDPKEQMPLADDVTFGALSDAQAQSIVASLRLSGRSRADKISDILEKALPVSVQVLDPEGAPVAGDIQCKDLRLSGGKWLFGTPQEIYFLLKPGAKDGEDPPWRKYGYLSFGHQIEHLFPDSENVEITLHTHRGDVDASLDLRNNRIGRLTSFFQLYEELAPDDALCFVRQSQTDFAVEVISHSASMGVSDNVEALPEDVNKGQKAHD